MNTNQSQIERLCYDLKSWINIEKENIFKLNVECTKDTIYAIEKDYQFITAYLTSYASNNLDVLNQLIKPKGKVVLVLSFNEPLITSIIPILNALLCGNDVIVRPSARGRDIFAYIWHKSNIVKKHKLKLHVLANSNPNLLEAELPSTKALYFFGGYKTAKNIAELCSKYFVQFYPEIEAADFKVVNVEKPDPFNFDIDVKATLDESFSHTGQSCQRVQGVFVAEHNYDSYKHSLESQFNDICRPEEILKYLSPSFQIDQEFLKNIENDILLSEPEMVIRGNSTGNLPVLVINPKPDTIFTHSAYFLPIIWLVKYKSEKELLEIIASRPYRLGMNILSDNKSFVNTLISSTCFTRYTINTDHTRVRLNEGWGGSWPTGYQGYRNWIEFFSNPYKIITA